MNTKNEKKRFLEIGGVQTVIASLICIILGLLVGYICAAVHQSGRSLGCDDIHFKELPVFPETGSCTGIFRKHPCQNGAASDVYPVHPFCLQGRAL